MLNYFLNTYWYPLFYTYKDKIINFCNRFLYPFYVVFAISSGFLFAKGYWKTAILFFSIGAIFISFRWYADRKNIID